MPTAATIFWGLVFPGLLVAAVLLLAWRRRTAYWINGPVMAGAFALAFAVLHAPVEFPAVNAVQWIFWFTIPLAALALLKGIFQPPIWLAALFLLVLWRLAMRALLGRLVPENLSAESLDLWIDAATAIILFLWLTFTALARQAPRMATPLVLALLCLGAGVMICTMLHSIQLGFLGLALFGMCLGAAAAAWINPKIALAHGGAAALVLLLMSLLVFAWFYTSDTLTISQQSRAAALLMSPLLAFVADLRPLRRARPAWRLTTRLLAVGLVVATVSALCVSDYAQAERAAAAQSAE